MICLYSEMTNNTLSNSSTSSLNGIINKWTSAISSYNFNQFTQLKIDTCSSKSKSSTIGDNKCLVYMIYLWKFLMIIKWFNSMDADKKSWMKSNKFLFNYTAK